MIHVTDRRLGAVVVACVLALAAPAAVLGHAELKTATPAAGSVQTKPVTEVAGVYTDSMKKDGSSIELLDASGASVAKGGLDPADDTRLVVSLDAPLVAGAYTVKWTSVASDGDLLRGEWAFTVAAAASASPSAAPPSAAPSSTPIPSAAATPSAVTSPTAVPSPTTAPSPSGDVSATSGSSDVLLPIIVALVLLGGGAAYLLNRRNRPSNPA
jgi:methionine-rich copper-binding protein CopC